MFWKTMSRMMKLAALSVGVAILVGVSPAVEADEGAGPDDLAVLVEAVEPDHGTEMILVEAQSLGSEAFVAEGDVAQVEVPENPLTAGFRIGPGRGYFHLLAQECCI